MRMCRQDGETYKASYAGKTEARQLKRSNGFDRERGDSSPPGEEPSGSDLMAMLHSMRTLMDARFDEVRQKRRDLRQESAAM
ncbi:hypothetical protein ACOMHN_054321 [Nucella lapillus]